MSPVPFPLTVSSSDQNRRRPGMGLHSPWIEGVVKYNPPQVAQLFDRDRKTFHPPVTKWRLCLVGDVHLRTTCLGQFRSSGVLGWYTGHQCALVDLFAL